MARLSALSKLGKNLSCDIPCDKNYTVNHFLKYDFYLREKQYAFDVILTYIKNI